MAKVTNSGAGQPSSGLGGIETQNAPANDANAPAGTKLDALLADISKAQKENKPSANDAATAVAKVPDAAPSREAMLAELAQRYGVSVDEIAKSLRVDGGVVTRSAAPTDGPLDMPLPEGTEMYPIELISDYWAGKQIADQWPVPPEPGSDGDNRCKAGSKLRLPIEEAMRLIEEGKAKRGDKMSTKSA